MPFVPDEPVVDTPSGGGRFVPDAAAPSNPYEVGGAKYIPGGAPSERPSTAAPVDTRSIPRKWFDKTVGGVEALGSLGSGVVGGLAGPIAGMGRVLTGGKIGTPEGAREGAQTAADVASAVTYQPRTQEGQELVSSAGKALDASKIAGLGPAEGMMLGGAAKPALTTKTTPPLKPADNVPRPAAGTGATKVAGELQRQRDVMEGKHVAAAPSEYETAVKGFDDKIEPMKKEALGLKARVDHTPTLQMIKELEAANPDKNVRAALKEVRDTMRRAKPTNSRDIWEGGGGLTVPMLDEVRQSINRLIEMKGDKALDSHTASVLAQVREDLVGRSPGIYQKYLKAYGEGRGELDRFNPEQTAVGKLTGTEPGYQPLAGAEAQKAIETAMTGKRSTRDLSDLVAATAHDPAAAQGLRESFAEWVTAPDPVLGKPKAGDLLTKWEKSRADAVSSGLMTAEHAKEVDGVAQSIREAAKGGALRKTAAYLVGYIAPGPHPFMFAHRLEQSVDSLTKKNTTAKMESAIMRLAMTPEGAQALNAPPTPANIERVRGMLPTDIAAAVTVPTAQAESRKRDVFSMEPPVLQGAPKPVDKRTGGGAFVRG